MTRPQERWGGDVRVPRWLRSLLGRPADPGDSPERAHERHRSQQPDRSVSEAADRAAVGPLSELYREGRKRRREGRRPLVCCPAENGAAPTPRRLSGPGNQLTGAAREPDPRFGAWQGGGQGGSVQLGLKRCTVSSGWRSGSAVGCARRVGVREPVAAIKSRRASPTGDERHNKGRSDPTGRQPQRESARRPVGDLLLSVGRHRRHRSKQQASKRKRG